MELDWVGVKIGDVNIDNDPSRSAGRVNKSLVFDVDDEQLIAGSQYKVTLQTSNFTDITGYQFTLQSDPGAVKIVGVEFSEEGLGVSEDNFNLNLIAQGVITTSWNTAEGITLPAGEDVFTLVLEAQKNISLSEVMTVNSTVTKAEAYNSADQLHDVSLSFGGTATVEAGFALYQNEPNPFKESTVIGFSLPESMSANLTVYDVTGKVLKSIEGDFVKGYNQVSLDQKEVSTSGVLYYQLDTEDYTATRKMIIIR